MNNPAHLIQTLDRHLDHEVSLVIFGRAALSLGFDSPRPEFHHTEDIDGIIRMSQLEELVNDATFWDAVEITNKELEPEGLYITHLFQADQIFLRPEWENHIVPVTRPETSLLKLFRPAAIDLVLTKMMRGADAQDMSDVEFLVSHDRITAQELEAAFGQAQLTDIPELHDAFERAKPAVREIAQRIAADSA